MKLICFKTVKLIEAIYAHARTQPNVADVTVEDPSEDFRPMRDLADILAIRSESFFSAPSECLAPETVEAIRGRLKICKHQILKCWFVFEFRHAQRMVAGGDADAMRRFRMRVKAHIAARYSDWLQDSETAEEKKKTIEEIFREHERDFTELLNALDRST